ncbi:MAG TPA: transcription initiation factor IIB 2 [Candidatus Poseidoniales archaeon]|nr:transcription initiation factor IIB 2 [Euryarchaeota archaeon]DAC66302.1 MAG TPA: transcription initiation factor IIB 2 [Candidatus Poseidoniales archaeon]
MPAEVLNSARPTIQLLVNMNERRTKSQAGKEKSTMKNDERKKPFVTGVRPSQARNTEAVSGSCEVCGSDEWDTDVRRGETNCAVCGFVAAQNMIDPGAEWVNYSDGANRSRVGAPTTLTLSDKGLSSEISRVDLTSGAAKRHGMSGKSARDWRRRQRIDQRSKTRDSRARNLTSAMQFIRDRGGLTPQIEQQAASLYRHAVERGLVTGRSIRGVTAACVYIAAREAKLPRKIDDIAAAFDMRSEVEQKELKRTIRLVARNLGTHHITGPEEYFEKFHSDLQLPPTVLGAARDMWKIVGENLSWQGKKPSGIAGVILYRASQESESTRTQSEVCKVAGISEVTLRGLLKILNQLAPPIEV